MSTDAQPQPVVPNHKRRWLQFGLRTLLGLIAVLAVWLGLLVNSAERQKRAVAAVRELGGVVYYEYDGLQAYQDTSAAAALDPASDADQDRPWLRRLLGVDYFRSAYFVDFSQTQVGDAGLASLAGISRLEALDLKGAQVRDAGLDHLKKLSRLKVLDLSETQITDAGLARLSALTRLERLNLEDTQVADAGLAQLEGLTRLETLQMANTQTTDAGLAHLTWLTGLRWLTLNGARVTDEGIAELRRDLPGCRIDGP